MKKIELNEFNALCAKKGLSKRKIAEILNLSPSTFYRRLESGEFTRGETIILRENLGKEIMDLFF